MLGLLADVLSLALPVQLLLLASTVLRCCCVAGWRGSSSGKQVSRLSSPDSGSDRRLNAGGVKKSLSVQVA